MPVSIFIISIAVSTANAQRCIDIFSKNKMRRSTQGKLPIEVENMLNNLFSDRTPEGERVAQEVIGKFSEPLQKWNDLNLRGYEEGFKAEFESSQRTYSKELQRIAKSWRNNKIDEFEARTQIKEAFLESDFGGVFYRNDQHTLTDRLVADRNNDALNFVANHTNGIRFWSETIVDPALSVVPKQFDMTRFERSAMESYTGDSAKFNDPLRAGKKGHRYDPALRRMLLKQEPYEGVVFRDAGHVSGKTRDALLTPGSIVSDKAFMSTSRAFTPTYISGKVTDTTTIIMVIRSRTGRSIENISSFKKREREVLFLPDVKFKVEMVQEGPGNSYTVYMNEL